MDLKTKSSVKWRKKEGRNKTPNVPVYIQLDSVNKCLDILEMLAYEGVNAMKSEKWRRADERYHQLTTVLKSDSAAIEDYCRRYSMIIDIMDKNTQGYTFTQRISKGKRLGARIAGKDFPGEFREGKRRNTSEPRMSFSKVLIGNLEGDAYQ